MPKKSKLNDHADWVLLRSNQDSRTIAAAYKETFGTSVSHVAVANWLKKNAATQLSKINAKAERTYIVDVEKAKSLLDDLITSSWEVERMSLQERNAFRSKLEAVREKLRVLGAYAPTTQTAVAVQVNIGEFKKRAWEILGESTSTATGSGNR